MSPINRLVNKPPLKGTFAVNFVNRTTTVKAAQRNIIAAVAMIVPAFNAQPKHDDRVEAFLEKTG